MIYHYRAADQEGNLVDGDVDAPTLQEALRLLSQKDLRPISLKPVKTEKSGGLTGLFGGRITISDKVFLTKYLGLMLRVGTDLLSAINILIADAEKPAMRIFLLEIRENLTRGEPFYTAFANHPKTFPATFVSLVKAAETSGNLQKTFEDLNVSLASDADLQNKVRSAFIYPVVLLCMATAIMTFLVTFALPKVAGVFSESGVTPPLFADRFHDRALCGPEHHCDLYRCDRAYHRPHLFCPQNGDWQAGGRRAAYPYARHQEHLPRPVHPEDGFNDELPYESGTADRADDNDRRGYGPDPRIQVRPAPDRERRAVQGADDRGIVPPRDRFAAIGDEPDRDLGEGRPY